jgi:Tfp pilus assembly protein PilX
MKHSRPHERGAILLLSVLIMASVTAIAGGIAALIATDLRSNQNVDQGIQAHYQAESALEAGLETVRKNRNSGTCSNAATTSCQQDSDCPAGGSCQYRTFSQTLADAMAPLPGVAARTTATGTSRLVINELPKDQSVQMNIYDPDNLLSDALQIRKISFTGTTTNNAWLEVSWSGWLNDGSGTFFDQTTKRLLSGCAFDPAQFASCGSNSPEQITLTDANPQMIAFQVRVKAILGDVKNITVQVYNQLNQEVRPPSHISIKSVGTVGRAQTALSAVVPWRLPASGLFDFVLFSEETIKKDPT